MKKSIKKIFNPLVLIIILFSIAGVDRVFSGMPQINPDDYPAIGKEEMGQLRWALKIADQPLDDFVKMEALNQYGMTAYRYGTAFLTYFLAVEQYHKLPACTEIIKPRMDRLISKIIQKPVWEFWAEVSRGVPMLEPRLNKPYPEEHDPVGNRNIMYSGHLGHMIALYEMLYRDLKWSGPDTIVFAWSDDETYVYNNHSLQMVMYDQMMNNPDHCIECEPNACFPECNQHPILSFMLYDHVHGTDLADARELFLEFFLKNKMIDPRNHHAAALYFVKQRKTLSKRSPGLGSPLTIFSAPAVSLNVIRINSASADGWTGTFMHAWQPEYIERHYPYQRDGHLVEMGKETARLGRDTFEPRLSYGFFAMLASEMGDTDTRDRLLAYADEKYDPVWMDGNFYYPFSKDKKCVALTGTLLAFARANPKSGVWALHSRPFEEKYFAQPKVVDVEFPEILLRRAIYDESKKALIVTVEPGTEESPNTSFKIVNLDPAKSYVLLIDGKEVKTIRGENSIKVEMTLSARQDVVLAETQ